jgi:hypothetical protein
MLGGHTVLALFANFEAKREQNSSKNEKKKISNMNKNYIFQFWFHRPPPSLSPHSYNCKKRGKIK